MLDIESQSNGMKFWAALSSAGLLILSLIAGTCLLLAGKLGAEWYIGIPRLLGEASVGLFGIAVPLLIYFLMLSIIMGYRRTEYGIPLLTLFAFFFGSYLVVLILSFVSMFGCMCHSLV